MNQTATDTRSPGSSWTMWLPCLAMALCSWLAFVDRQVLAVLSPTILKETGMSAGDFGNIVFFFFVAYTVANPVWGSLIDRVGLRIGLFCAVLIWSVASSSHAFMGTFAGFAFSRALLGLGEGATFPGGLRTAVESLPVGLRARGIATAFSGGTLGAILTPLIVIPIALQYGWRAAFLLTGLLGIVWLAIWWLVARPPYLPRRTEAPAKLGFPNVTERRFWALVFSYSLPAISAGPILTIFPLYLNKGLGVSQADLKSLLWIPPAAWGIGYFCWGWVADRFAGTNRRPVWLFLLLTALALPFGLTTLTSSPLLTVMSMGLSTFIAGGFQMVALKVGSFAYPRERAAMMSGIASGSWSLVNAALSPRIGKLFDAHAWSEAFWLVALCPVVGVAVWLWLSRGDGEARTNQA
jgi:ACS family hexuronate transporter-like MFS transporter